MLSTTILWIFCGIFWAISGLPIIYQCLKQKNKNKKNNNDYVLLTESYNPSSSSEEDDALFYDIECQ